MAEEQQQPLTPQSLDPSTPAALRILAQVITYIFHPVFMPTAMAFVLMKLLPGIFQAVPPKQQGLWLISIAVSTLVFPVFSIALMKPLGFISSYHMHTNKDRIIPLMTSMIFYFWIDHVFANMPGFPVPVILRVMMLGNFWLLIAVFMFNIFTKISIHTAGAGCVVGVIGVLMITSDVNMVVPFFIAVVLAGLIGTARLLLHAHTPKQIWMGYALGIIAPLAAYLYL
jgi:hypothetical protein